MGAFGPHRRLSCILNQFGNLNVKSNTTKQDVISGQERRDGRGSVSVRREGSCYSGTRKVDVRIVDLDSMETRICLVSGILSVGERAGQGFGRVDCVMTGRGEPRALGCAGYRSWELINV